jgi:hypothetical protein
MNKCRVALLGCLIVGLSSPLSLALADPWKDESGHGRRGREWRDDDRRSDYERLRRHRERHWEAERRREEAHRRAWARDRRDRERDWADAQNYERPPVVVPVPVPVPVVPVPEVPLARPQWR